MDIDQYADDTAITASAEIGANSKLQESLTIALHEVENWAKANKLPLNETKTTTMLVTDKRLQDKLTPEDRELNLRTLNGHLLEQKDQARVLGLELGSEPCFSPHADQVCVLW